MRGWRNLLEWRCRRVDEVEELVCLDGDVVSGFRHQPGDILRRRLVTRLAGVAGRHAVRPWMGIGDRLEGLHVFPEIVRLDTRQELARGVVDLGVALS